MVKLLSLTALVLASSLSFANSPREEEIFSIETVEIPVTQADYAKKPAINTDLGQVIQITKDLIALGELIYPIVQKGRPSVSVSYAPINVLPRDPATRQYVDPFDITGTSDPVTKKFKTVIKGALGTAAQMEYLVIFSYGGSWNGKGKYVQNAAIIPTSAKASFGYDFSANMKLDMVSNKGTAASPVATATMSISYSVKNVFTDIQKTDVFYVTGNGEFKAASK